MDPLPQSKGLEGWAGLDPRSGGPGLLWLCLSAHASLGASFLLTLSLRPFTAASPTGPAQPAFPERGGP